MTQMIIVPIKVISEAIKLQCHGVTGHLGSEKSGDFFPILKSVYF